MLRILWKISTQTQIILGWRSTVGSLEVYLSILHSVQDARTSFPDIELNVSRRALLLSPTGLLCHAVKVWTSSMAKMSTQSWRHSESRLHGPRSTSA